MKPGSSGKCAIPRSRSGCLTCRSRKVKCDEVKPVCRRCKRLSVLCNWDLHHHIKLCRGMGEFPSSLLPRLADQYIAHFFDHCSQFLIYPHDYRNPLQSKLQPLAASSTALLYSLAAIAAGHLSRAVDQYKADVWGHPHKAFAAYLYTQSVGELRSAIYRGNVDPDAVLGASLFLCVYEISYSEDRYWLKHLQGAKSLLTTRKPQPNNCLTRLFSYLSICGSLFSGYLSSPSQYWTGDGAFRWPWYDSEGLVTSRTSMLLSFLAGLSTFLNDSTSNSGRECTYLTADQIAQVEADLSRRWDLHLPKLPNDWRHLPRPIRLSQAETMENEAFSRTKMCFYGCIIYLNLMIHPSLSFHSQQLVRAVDEVLDIAEKTPEGHDLEIGLYWGLFMAGVAIFNDVDKENFIRRKMTLDTQCVFHAASALEFLEKLWAMQHKAHQKLDWRKVENEMRSQLFILI